MANLLIGYARALQDKKDLARQFNRLEQAGCSSIVVESGNGAGPHQPDLAGLLATLSPGDLLVVCRLDRLAWSVQDLMTIAATLTDHQANLWSLAEGLNTQQPNGASFFPFLELLRGFDKATNSERTRQTMAAARQRGQSLGRPSKRPTLLAQAQVLLAEPGMTREAVAARLGISRATLYRYLAAGNERP